MTHIYVGNLTTIGSNNGLSLVGAKSLSEPSWNIDNCTLRNKFQWNSKRNSNIFIQENAPENVVCEMASILSRPRCVNYKAKNKTQDTFNQVLCHGFIMTWKHFMFSISDHWCFPCTNSKQGGALMSHLLWVKQVIEKMCHEWFEAP